MTDQTVVEMGLGAMIIAAKMAAPMLLTALAVGFIISLFQAVTQIQEVTLTFVPKAIAIAIVLVITGNWMMQEMMFYTRELYGRIPELLQ